MYRENKPISMQLRPLRPNIGYQSVPYEERNAVYLDKSDKFSRQPFSDLVANQPTRATYCHGYLFRQNIITEQEFFTLIG